MKTHSFVFFVCFFTVLSANAAPSAVGDFGGSTPDESTFVAFESTRRGFIRNLEVVGLNALCTTTLPGQAPLPAEERSTNLTRRETPLIRLRRSGDFSEVFHLIDPSRVDFHGAEVRVSGRLRGDRGRISLVLLMEETYFDGSSMSCGGSVRLPVRLAPRR